jgi:hypothetical protein
MCAQRFGGGDWLKFSNVIVAMFSLVLLSLILDAFLMVGFIPISNGSRAREDSGGLEN